MNAIPKIFMASTLLLSSAFGCSTVEDDPVGHEFRTLTLDVDVRLTVADGGDDDGTIIWEVLEVASVPANGETTWELREYEPGTHPADGGDDDGTIIWEILELTTSSPGGGTTTTWELSNAAGTPVCEAEDGELRDSSTGALLLQEASRGNGIEDATGSLLYTFGRTGVLDPTGGTVVGTTPDQEGATDGRRLIIAAVLEGECGS